MKFHRSHKKERNLVIFIGIEVCLNVIALCKTRNKMRVAIESGKGVKVKVVKLC